MLVVTSKILALLVLGQSITDADRLASDGHELLEGFQYYYPAKSAYPALTKWDEIDLRRADALFDRALRQAPRHRSALLGKGTSPSSTPTRRAGTPVCGSSGVRRLGTSRPIASRTRPTTGTQSMRLIRSGSA